MSAYARCSLFRSNATNNNTRRNNNTTTTINQLSQNLPLSQSLLEGSETQDLPRGWNGNNLSNNYNRAAAPSIVSRGSTSNTTSNSNNSHTNTSNTNTIRGGERSSNSSSWRMACMDIEHPPPPSSRSRSRSRSNTFQSNMNTRRPSSAGAVLSLTSSSSSNNKDIHNNNLSSSGHTSTRNSNNRPSSSSSSRYRSSGFGLYTQSRALSLSQQHHHRNYQHREEDKQHQQNQYQNDNNWTMIQTISDEVMQRILPSLKNIHAKDTSAAAVTAVPEGEELVKEHQNRIKHQQSQIESLESTIHHLTARVVSLEYQQQQQQYQTPNHHSTGHAILATATAAGCIQESQALSSITNSLSFGTAATARPVPVTVVQNELFEDHNNDEIDDEVVSATQFHNRSVVKPKSEVIKTQQQRPVSRRYRSRSASRGRSQIKQQDQDQNKRSRVSYSNRNKSKSRKKLSELGDQDVPCVNSNSASWKSEDEGVIGSIKLRNRRRRKSNLDKGLSMYNETNENDDPFSL